MDIGLEVGDGDAEDAEGGVDGEDVLDISLVLDVIDGLDLGGRGVTLLSSHMAMGTRSRISMWEE